MPRDFGVLPSSFYDRDVRQVARSLLGQILVRQSRDGRTVGRIVEVEAYLAAGDSACHAARGQTPRNRAMFGAPGLAYVYAIHSRWCLNTVTDAPGQPSAVLIRAVEPLEGVALMATRRNTAGPLQLARGPGRLCEAFAIDKRLNQHELSQGIRLWIEAGAPLEEQAVATSPRIGVTSAHDLPLRYFERGNRFVSGPRKWHA